MIIIENFPSVIERQSVVSSLIKSIMFINTFISSYYFKDVIIIILSYDQKINFDYKVE
jgi:hypothetical protein